MRKNLLSLGCIALFSFLFTSSLQAQELTHVLDEALVRLKPHTDIKTFQKDIRVFNGVNSSARVGRLISKQMNVYQVHFDIGAVNEYEFRDFIFRHPSVEVVQVNHILTSRETIPDDPFLNDQWQWINTGQTGGTDDADIDMDLAWDITTGGLTANGDVIVVAVYDTGGDLDHPDLIANNWVNLEEIAGDGIDNDGNGYVDDVNGWNFGGNNNNVEGGGHGVSVAGMIGGVGNNTNQGTGVNWDVKIMNCITSSIQQESNVIEFYSYALDMRQLYNETGGERGAFVVATNSSWGIDGGDPDSAPLWCAFYDSLGVAGILSCGATTNGNDNVDVVGDLPTACPSEFMVAVTATNDEDNRTFSGFGPINIDVGAPGADIFTTAIGGGYTTTSGTSFASPTTAGVIALMYSAPCSNIATLALADPMEAAEQIRDYLYEGSEMVGNLDGDVAYGRINAFNSLELIMANCGPCPPPAGINISDVVDVEGTINWTSPPDGQSSTLRFREVGATDWTDTLSNVVAPFTLTGLTACTEYEVQIEATCTDTVSGYSNSFIFQTDGCCEAPAEFMVSDVDSTSALASWSSVFAAMSYNLRYREIGTAGWITVNTTDLNFDITGLDICTNYEVQVQTVCANEMTDFTDSQTFTTFGCGACVDLSYCASGGGTFDEEHIGAVMIHTLSNSTPEIPDAGYTDFTGSGITTTLETFGTYDVTLTPTFPGQAFPEYWKIWIDYNQDGAFDEITELAFDSEGTSNEVVMGTITVPSDAMSGFTRLRVSMKWNATITSCEMFDFGETEDYCITIEEGTPTCDVVPSFLTASSITETSATLNWGSVANATSYLVNYKETSSATWTEESSTVEFLNLTGLTDCTDYDFRVASVCFDSLTSEFSTIEQFTTLCACPSPLNLDTMNVTTDAATLLWDAATNADSYEMRYRLLASAAWATQAVATTTVDISGLTDCSDYEYQVRTICSNNQSGWTNSFNFSTQCIISVGEINNGVDGISLYPNPFEENIQTQFTLSENTELNINVYNATGQLISQNVYNLGSGEQNISIEGLSELSKGIYFVSFTTAKGTKVRRVIKQ